MTEFKRGDRVGVKEGGILFSQHATGTFIDYDDEGDAWVSFEEDGTSTIVPPQAKVKPFGADIPLGTPNPHCVSAWKLKVIDHESEH